MKTYTAVLSALVLVPVMTANVLAQGYSVIDQSTYNSLMTTAIWHGEGATIGDLSISSGTAQNGDSVSFYAPTVVPIDISQANGTLTIFDNSATPHSFIPPSSASINSLAPITGFAISLSLLYAAYSPTITDVSYSIDGGSAVSIPGSLDTSSTSWEGIEVLFNENVSTFSIDFNLNLPTSGSGVEFDVLGLNPVPEPSTVALGGLGAFGLVAYGRARKDFIQAR
jgi:hypothetical protein